MEAQGRPGGARGPVWLEGLGGWGQAVLTAGPSATPECAPPPRHRYLWKGVVLSLSTPSVLPRAPPLACLPRTSDGAGGGWGAAQERWQSGLIPGDLGIPETWVSLGSLVPTYLTSRTRACRFLM